MANYEFKTDHCEIPISLEKGPEKTTGHISKWEFCTQWYSRDRMCALLYLYQVHVYSLAVSFGE